MYSERLKKLGIDLPVIPKPLASYVPGKLSGNYIYTSGQLPSVNGVLNYKGKVTVDITEEEAIKAASISAINCIAVAAQLAGGIDNIEEIVKVVVFVNSPDGYGAQPKIANGASNLLLEIFGEKGKHARSAVGVTSLPLNAVVEIEMIAKIK